MSVPACIDCQRLWRELVRVTMVEIRVRNRRTLAEKGYIVALPGALEHAERSAAESCEQARQIIKQHERSHEQHRAA
jgi:hypothetical protein